MNYFLEHEDHQNLSMMAILRPKSFSRNGRDVSGKLFLLGENEVLLRRVYLRESRNGKYHVGCEFTRDKTTVQQLMTPIEFAPCVEILFDYDKASEICSAFGHELKPMPEGYDFNKYMTAIARRIRTFVGNKCYAVVYYAKESLSDEYGRVKKSRTGFKRYEDVTTYVQRMTYHKDKPTVDWNMLQNTLINE